MIPSSWPGLGADPTPGEPDLVRALAAALSDVEDMIRGVCDHLGALGRQVTPQIWRGGAADAFHAALSRTHGALGDLAAEHARAHAALTQYQVRLRGAQQESRAAEADAVRARAGIAEATTARDAARTEAAIQSRAAEQADVAAALQRASDPLGLLNPLGQLWAAEVGGMAETARAAAAQAAAAEEAAVARLDAARADLGAARRRGEQATLDVEDAGRTAAARLAGDRVPPPLAAGVAVGRSVGSAVGDLAALMRRDRRAAGQDESEIFDEGERLDGSTKETSWRPGGALLALGAWAGVRTRRSLGATGTRTGERDQDGVVVGNTTTRREGAGLVARSTSRSGPTTQETSTEIMLGSHETTVRGARFDRHGIGGAWGFERVTGLLLSHVQAMSIGGATFRSWTSAMIGTRAGVKVAAAVSWDGARLAGGVEYFAGGEVARGLSGEVGGIGGAVEGKLQAGVGGKADADASVSRERIRLKLELGLVLGIGASGAVTVDVDPAELSRNIAASSADYLVAVTPSGAIGAAGSVVRHADDVRDAAVGALGGSADLAQGAVQRAGDVADRAGDAARDVAGGVADRAGDAAEKAGRAAEKAGDGLRKVFRW